MGVSENVKIYTDFLNVETREICSNVTLIRGQGRGKGRLGNCAFSSSQKNTLLYCAMQRYSTFLQLCLHNSSASFSMKLLSVSAVFPLVEFYASCL